MLPVSQTVNFDRCLQHIVWIIASLLAVFYSSFLTGFASMVTGTGSTSSLEYIFF